MDDTLFQFGRASLDDASKTSPTRATLCPSCGNHFSPDGRFCPFDGEPLLPAPDYNPASDSLIGTVVDGRYEVLSVLGEGGMGIVYATRHRALGKRFALKALRKDLASDAEVAARFTQEAQTAASVSHPGLVEITDFGRLSSGQPFFVMELLEGRSLASMIRRGGPIPAVRAAAIIRQIAEALSAAHERSIVHRDLKPDNIHISPTEGGGDRVTVVDFGLAKVVGAGRLTRAGMVFGTPHYMSPEQATGELTDHRADVYALGVVMYEMLTGRVPFEADSYMGVLTKHMYVAPTPPSHLPGMAELGKLEAILLRCLEKKADQRYATLRDLVSELDRVELRAGEPPAFSSRPEEEGPSATGRKLELPTPFESAPPPARSHTKMTRWRFFSVVGALFLVGIASMLIWRTFFVHTFEVSPTTPDALPSAERASARVTAPSPSPAPPSPSPPESARLNLSPDSDLLTTDESGRRATALAPGSSSGAVLLRKTAPRKPSPTSAAPRSKVLPFGSEIVDPWAKAKSK